MGWLLKEQHPERRSRKSKALEPPSLLVIGHDSMFVDSRMLSLQGTDEHGITDDI